VTARDADEDRLARAVLLRVSEPGDRAMAELVAQHGALETLDRIRSAHPPEAAHRWLPRLAGADGCRDLTAAAAAGAALVVPADSDWPRERLDALRVPPVGLYVKGPHWLRVALARSVSVVGSRASTAYGEHVAAELAADLAAQGWTVVSGGAYGIDGAAHRAALAVGGLTVAVLANGVDRTYPQGHAALLSRVGEAGLVVSELSPGEHPTRTRFIERNRLIAAMTLGTVAVEMALRSGASTTVERAHGLGRMHMAVPGPVTSPMSAGCHHWIATKNATLVTCAADVLALVAPLGEVPDPPSSGPTRPTDVLDAESLRLWEALPTHGPRPVSELAAAAGIAARDLGSRLQTLVRHGLARTDGVAAERATRAGDA
jgi:DNA processing protein